MPQEKAPKRKQVNFRIDIETFKHLKKVARLHKITRTDLLTELIRAAV
jgi:uncharacterized protein (DUF1778 family)